MSELQRQSSLRQDARDYIEPGVHIREIEPVAKLRVQVLRARGSENSAVDSGMLPARPNGLRGADPWALWKAPDDWLLYSQRDTAEDLNQWVAGIASDSPLIATDVSPASVLIELTGAGVIDLLQRDCTLDLEGGLFRSDTCAQTALAQTTVMIHRRIAPDSWRLFVERSVAVHVWDWLLNSASGR